MGRSDRHHKRAIEKKNYFQALWPFNKENDRDQREEMIEDQANYYEGRNEGEEGYADFQYSSSSDSLRGRSIEEEFGEEKSSLGQVGRLKKQKKMKAYDRFLNRAIALTLVAIIVVIVLAFII
ncbi:hypothetical protein D3H64_06970 [Atopobacter sp. AH10]|uniref:hypothetical protein n=1 Tax=Atopobacter sp. AH10 TaxID=2315861 RepID=UPI000EF24065|nr:hypothetical protein [Atopobacter sp. AH10]RLK62956.1 hypothetical protein D3H64_06970 [Atopobacter sp. AH10]